MTRAKIKVDISGLKNRVSSISTRVQKSAVVSTQARVLQLWKWKAQRALHKTRGVYTRALVKTPVTVRSGNAPVVSGEVRLIGKFPSMLERGFGPFDMKPGLLRSSKAKMSAKGVRYIRVPIGETIRTVTENSKGWKHPGFAGVHILKSIRERAVQILTQELRKRGAL